MSAYQSDPNAPPDSEFEPGALHHLVVGNRGRLLDPRRTPVSVVGARPEVGMFVVRLEAFEDRGATWEIPFEEVDRYQFARGSGRAPPGAVRDMRDAAARFDRPHRVALDPEAAAVTRRRLASERAAAQAWLAARSRFLRAGGALPEPESRRGDARLCRDLRQYLAERGLAEIERGFARQWVRGPHAGEIVKGHCIVVAELGLVPYEGKIVRDPATFEGPWEPRRRADHILARLGFVQGLFASLGLDRLVLYRGLSLRGPLVRRHETFVSATFSRAVAESHFAAGGEEASGVLLRQAVPVERVFMTCLETFPMNRRYREAEAVLLDEAGGAVF